MSFALGIVSVLAIALLAAQILLRRQLRMLAKELARLREEETRKLLMQQVRTPEITELVTEINELLTKERLRRMEMEKSNRRFRSALLDLSHDVRTPLTALKGYFQLLSEAEHEEDRERYARIVDDRIEGLEKLLGDLFEAMRAEDDTMPLLRSECDVKELLAETLLSFYTEFRAIDEEPKVDMPEHAVRIHTHPETLQRIFTNLLRNALFHGTPPFRVCLREDDTRIRMEFINGLSEEAVASLDVEAMFTRFYKSDRVRAHAGSTGLGLSIVKALVTKLGGTVQAHAEQNTLRIEVVLPRVA